MKIIYNHQSDTLTIILAEPIVVESNNPEEDDHGTVFHQCADVKLTQSLFGSLKKEKQIEIKNGKRKTVEKRIFPGYVLVEMIVTDDSWYVVRNTPGVTGFVGSGNIPTPISNKEMKIIFRRMQVEEPKYKIEIEVGAPVKIIDGPFKGFEGKINEIDEEKGRIKVLVSLFDSETTVDTDFLQIKKI